jgi:hypothetical protein
VNVERRLISPPFQQHDMIAVGRALENIELLTAGLFPAFRRTLLERFRKLGAFASRRGKCDYESNRHACLRSLE